MVSQSPLPLFVDLVAIFVFLFYQIFLGGVGDIAGGKHGLGGKAIGKGQLFLQFRAGLGEYLCPSWRRWLRASILLFWRCTPKVTHQGITKNATPVPHSSQ